MSLSEVERFATDLQSNAALKAEAEKAQADKSHATPIDRAVAFAATKGYAFSADEAKAHVLAKAKASDKELSDAELDGVAGGFTNEELQGPAKGHCRTACRLPPDYPGF